MPKVSAQDQLRASAHAVELLNQLDSTLGGWVLGFSREQIDALTGPIYELLDKDEFPQKVTA